MDKIIKEKLSKDGNFKAKVIDYKGEEVILEFDTIIYSKDIVDNYEVDELFIALDDYDLLNLTPISKVVEIL
jgi:hypothetical protein